MTRALQLGLLLVVLAGCQQERPQKQAAALDSAAKTKITVAAASDLQFAFGEIAAEFAKEHPQIEIATTYGSSGNFFAQLSNVAPFDLFLSADIAYPRKLVEQNLAMAESEFQYAIGHLVVWVLKESPLDVETRGIEVLTDPSVRKIAIANPKTAPYGRAAEAALKHFSLDEKVADRLVFGENVGHAAQFVESGAADVGLIALSLALAPVMREKGRYWEVPLEAHPPLEQGGVILNWAHDRAACEKLRSFLMAEQGRDILRRYGFLMPGE